jgi:hypothetical protein
LRVNKSLTAGLAVGLTASAFSALGLASPAQAATTDNANDYVCTTSVYLTADDSEVIVTEGDPEERTVTLDAPDSIGAGEDIVVTGSYEPPLTNGPTNLPNFSASQQLTLDYTVNGSGGGSVTGANGAASTPATAGPDSTLPNPDPGAVTIPTSGLEEGDTVEILPAAFTMNITSSAFGGIYGDTTCVLDDGEVPAEVLVVDLTAPPATIDIANVQNGPTDINTPAAAVPGVRDGDSVSVTGNDRFTPDLGAANASQAGITFRLCNTDGTTGCAPLNTAVVNVQPITAGSLGTDENGQLNPFTFTIVTQANVGAKALVVAETDGPLQNGFGPGSGTPPNIVEQAIHQVVLLGDATVATSTTTAVEGSAIAFAGTNYYPGEQVAVSTTGAGNPAVAAVADATGAIAGNVLAGAPATVNVTATGIGSAVQSATSVVVTAKPIVPDTTAPVVKVDKPSKKKAVKGSTWKTVKGTITDAAPANVKVKAVVKTGKGWKFYNGKKWKSAKNKKAALKKAKVLTDSSVTTGKWNVKIKKAAPVGKLTVQYWGADTAGNTSAKKSLSQKIKK